MALNFSAFLVALTVISYVTLGGQKTSKDLNLKEVEPTEELEFIAEIIEDEPTVIEEISPCEEPVEEEPVQESKVVQPAETKSRDSEIIKASKTQTAKRNLKCSCSPVDEEPETVEPEIVPTKGKCPKSKAKSVAGEALEPKKAELVEPEQAQPLEKAVPTKPLKSKQTKPVKKPKQQKPAPKKSNLKKLK